MASIKVLAKAYKTNGITEIKCGKFTFQTSLPKDFGGVGGVKVPTPIQLQMAALAGCIIEVFTLVSREKNLLFEDISVDVVGEVDLEGIRGVKDRYAGISNFKVKVRVKGVSLEDARRVLEETMRRCPVGLALERENSIETEISS